jgi:hypothetical protein
MTFTRKHTTYDSSLSFLLKACEEEEQVEAIVDGG